MDNNTKNNTVNANINRANLRTYLFAGIVMTLLLSAVVLTIYIGAPLTTYPPATGQPILWFTFADGGEPLFSDRPDAEAPDALAIRNPV